MLSFWSLIKRNTKVYFKDKGVFFTSLITPLILLCLFVTFMRNVYIDTIKTSVPAELNIPQSVFEGFAGGWLISSLLAVSCITVAFCANMIMVSDKVNGSIKDIRMTPVKSSILSLGKPSLISKWILGLLLTMEISASTFLSARSISTGIKASLISFISIL